jgi:hypothetical protein
MPGHNFGESISRWSNNNVFHNRSGRDRLWDREPFVLTHDGDEIRCECGKHATLKLLVWCLSPSRCPSHNALKMSSNCSRPPKDGNLVKLCSPGCTPSRARRKIHTNVHD